MAAYDIQAISAAGEVAEIVSQLHRAKVNEVQPLPIASKLSM